MRSLREALLARGWTQWDDGCLQHSSYATLISTVLAPGEGEVQVAYLANHHGWLPADRDSDLLVFLRRGKVSP